MSGGSAASVSRPDLLAGAQLQAASLPLETVFSWDASTANREIITVQPESVFGSSTQSSFHLAAISQPGLQLDFFNSKLIFDCTLTQGTSAPSPIAAAPAVYVSLLLFNEYTLYINSVMLADQVQSLDAFAAFCKLALQEPYKRGSTFNEQTFSGVTFENHDIGDKEALEQIWTPNISSPDMATRDDCVIIRNFAGAYPLGYGNPSLTTEWNPIVCAPEPKVCWLW